MNELQELEVTFMKWLNVGKIVNTHGIQGEVRVISTTDFPEERYKLGSELVIFKPRSKEPIPVIVTGHRRHKNFDLLTFEGYPYLSDVEQFKGSELKVSSRFLTPLPEGEFYHFEIIGCQVVSNEDRVIGEVTQVLMTGANDVWEVQGVNGKMHYIPYIPSIVESVNIANKKVVIDVVEGLLNE